MLVIEHSPALRERLVAFVRELPAVWRVEDGACARDTVERLECIAFEAVVLDVDRPESTALVRTIRRLAPTSCIVALTGDGTPEARLRWMAAGVHHVVVKWDDVDALGKALLELGGGLPVR